MLAEAEGWCLSLNLTPKALANFSPGLARSDNPGAVSLSRDNPERVCQLLQGLMALLIVKPRVLAVLKPWAEKLANAFGVKFKLRHCQLWPCLDTPKPGLLKYAVFFCAKFESVYIQKELF
jgi:hypothetical protein